MVHSPLVGPQTWQLVASSLAGSGYEVVVPDLTGSLGGPPYAAGQAEVVAGSAGGGRAILVGHSGAGSLLVPAGCRLDHAAGYVFVDAGLPTPGRSSIGTMPEELASRLRGMADAEGWLPAWPEWWSGDEMAELLPDPVSRERFVAGCRRLPMAMLEEAQPDAPGWRGLPGAYLRLSAAYDGPAGEALALGWPVARLDGHHLAMLTHPDLVARSLVDLIALLPDR